MEYKVSFFNLMLIFSYKTNISPLKNSTFFPVLTVIRTLSFLFNIRKLLIDLSYGINNKWEMKSHPTCLETHLLLFLHIFPHYCNSYAGVGGMGLRDLPFNYIKSQTSKYYMYWLLFSSSLGFLLSPIIKPRRNGGFTYVMKPGFPDKADNI